MIKVGDGVGIIFVLVFSLIVWYPAVYAPYKVFVDGDNSIQYQNGYTDGYNSYNRSECATCYEYMKSHTGATHGAISSGGHYVVGDKDVYFYARGYVHGYNAKKGRIKVKKINEIRGVE